MVAWWLRGMTLLNLAVLVVWLAWAWPQSVPWALGGAVLWALAGRWWLGQQFVCLALVRRSRGEPPLALATLLRAWNAECRLMLRAFGWDMPWAEHAQADYVPDRPAGRPVDHAGVVLVHGWLCNRAIWADALHQLRAAGVPCIAVSMPLLLHRVGTGRAVLDGAARRMQAATGRAPVVVAHSMGGLVVRDWLRSLTDVDAPHRPQQVVTVGSPHHGTWMARWALGPNVAQMRPGNVWLQQLQRDEARPGSAVSRVQWHCALSDTDNMVFPGTTALLEGATPLWLNGMAHVEMLQAPALWTLVRQLVVQAPQAPSAGRPAGEKAPGTAQAEPRSIM